MQIYATITGDKEVQRNLKILMQKCEEKVENIVKIATIKTVAEAKKAAPVLSGRLRSSIAFSLSGMGTQYATFKGEIVTKITAPEKKAGNYVGVVGTDVKYAPHQEFGTKSQEFGTKRMKAHPFLYPALKIGMELLKRKIQNEIKKITV
jgi:HK97 gp10 family phage protein